MSKIIQYTKYGLYMLYFHMKGIKYNYIKHFKGNEAADDYIMKSAYLWSKFTIDIIGIDLDVHGIENIPDGTFVLIGNHSSILDIPIILYTAQRKIAFVAKKEIFKVPIIGRWIKRTGAVGLDRENPRSAIQTIKEAIESLNNGWSMGIFPEGTRNKEGKVGEFKKGSLKLATKSKFPIVPVSIDRASRCFEDTKSFLPNKVKVVYGKPIYTENLSKEELNTLAEDLREIIIKNLED